MVTAQWAVKKEYQSVNLMMQVSGLAGRPLPGVPAALEGLLRRLLSPSPPQRPPVSEFLNSGFFQDSAPLR